MLMYFSNFIPEFAVIYIGTSWSSIAPIEIYNFLRFVQFTSSYYTILTSKCPMVLDLPRNKEPLDWNTRIKIALGAVKGLVHLHEVDPPVIYRDLKSANILLDEEYNPKLSDFGLAKLGPVGDKTHVSTRVMGTYGYCAPDYAWSGKLTVKSDIYSFGVVLLELITGRKAFDHTRRVGEQSLVVWVCNCYLFVAFHLFVHCVHDH